MTQFGSPKPLSLLWWNIDTVEHIASCGGNIDTMEHRYDGAWGLLGHDGTWTRRNVDMAEHRHGGPQA